VPPRVPPEAIEALLPQTQCTKCGYAGCRPYAEALARAEADINRCPPGGEPVIARLAALLGRESKPLDPACGRSAARARAVIDEPRCIGCTLCIQACPVDAIVGAAGLMHTVLEESCTGCELCLPPCPVECIAMVALPLERAAWTQADARAAKARFEARAARLARPRAPRPNAARDERARRRAVVAAALERARRKRPPGSRGSAA